MRSAGRSRSAPPAFARSSGFGSASHGRDQGCRAGAEAEADKSNSMLPDRRRHNRLRSGSRLGISPSGLGRPVSTAPGRAFLNETTQKVWMFDNEIDWVIARRAMVPRTGCREAAGRALVTMTRIQGRAHCRAADAQALAANASVQCKKSVFRSSSQDVREHGRVALKAKLSRLSLIRTEAIRLPALELILWSSY